MSDCVKTSVWIFPGCCVIRISDKPGCLPSLKIVTSASVAAVLPSNVKNCVLHL